MRSPVSERLALPAARPTVATYYQAMANDVRAQSERVVTGLETPFEVDQLALAQVQAAG